MSGSARAESPDAPAPRWPGVVGTIGLVLAILTLIDKAGDLVVLLLAAESGWSGLIGGELGPRIAPLIPPAPWIALTSLVWLGLAILLLRASLFLRRRDGAAAPLCRLWSWLAIGWFAVDMAYQLWWLGRIADRLAALAPDGWRAYAVLGTLLAIALMLAFPFFLLVWLSRPEVLREVEGWQSSSG